MEQRTLKILEYHQVQALLAAETSSTLGQELALLLEPSVEQGQIETWQEETEAALTILWREGAFPLGGIRDLRVPLKRAKIGQILEPTELLGVLDVIQGAKKMKKFLYEHEAEPLIPYRRDLSSFPELEQRIEKAIGPDGEVKDSASNKLASTRSKIRNLQVKIRERLERMIHSEFNRYLQDPIVTIRQNRYVLPVKQEYRGQVKGLVHDQSASGQTLFIEPLAIVELNNQLRAAQSQEAEEVTRILSELSESVALATHDLATTLFAFAQLDLIVAKARLAQKMKAERPRLNKEGFIQLRGARHPLLKGEVVPIDVTLGQEHWIMVITGPNTGGKTVALKTVGLLTLMAQSGLMIPAKSGSELAIFRTIACDIGDEQSIEQSLSTFSGHMKNLVSILGQTEGEEGESFLALLDEVGAGTDPEEGAALAMAILEDLHRKGVRTIATTHYSELKSFAYLEKGILNASVEFNPDTLEPTYKLLSGVAGSSNALTIAKRLGLPEFLIDRATALIDPHKQEMGQLIEKIQTDKLEAEESRAHFQNLEARAKRLLSEREAQLRELDREKRELAASVQLQAENTLKAARSEMDSLIGRLKKLVAKLEREEVTKEKIQQEIEAARAGFAKAQEQLALPEVKIEEKADTRLWKAGMWALTPLGIEGELLTDPDDKGMVELGYGNLRVKINTRELEPKEAKPAPPPRSTFRVSQRAQNVKPELDLRGMNCDEAWEEVEQYLDSAYLANLENVRIIHGKGTGVLRRFLRDSLPLHPKVVSLRPGVGGEGGDGVTVVTLE